MPDSVLDTNWIWHPHWQDHASDSAGAFVHFQKSIDLPDPLPTAPITLQITADTKYRLYINGRLAHLGPVKGDEHMWFYDELDIAPFLKPGPNTVGVHVLRLYHGTSYGTSFPRMAIPGLFVRVFNITARKTVQLQSDNSWLTALDRTEFPAEISTRNSECYEDEPKFVPYLRCKGDRRDTTKSLLGPEDRFVLSGAQGVKTSKALSYTCNAAVQETYAPFHFRTFRFLTVTIEVVQGEDLIVNGIDVDETHYPLITTAAANTQNQLMDDLWSVSIRTLTNCMHDCYEDCPFYEQLQYAMDTRSSCLFTYAVSGDDRLARQALLQLHSTYQSELGLTASRGPASQLQVIPHFSLFWILAVVDHFENFGDVSFTRQFLPAADGILESFARRINPTLGLVAADTASYWEFVDWTPEWRPKGVPPAAERTGYLTYTNLLYGHTLKRLASTLALVGRPGLRGEVLDRASAVTAAVREHCRIGEVFTDGLASSASQSHDFSQQTQTWAVLGVAVSGEPARALLKRCLPVLQRSADTTPGTGSSEPVTEACFTATSLAMTFYVFRALSAAGGSLYDDAVHGMWAPWRLPLAQNLTTWCEDHVTNRSDCHAWGCCPLYELTAEVAGVSPAEAGWGSVAFKPRTTLFPRFKGKVPIGAKGVAFVEWARNDGDDGKTTASITVVGSQSDVDMVPIVVTFPDGREENFLQSSLSLVF